MFESGKKQQKTAEKQQESVILLPTIEQIFEFWENDFEVLLLCSERLDRDKLDEFNKNKIDYCKSVVKNIKD